MLFHLVTAFFKSHQINRTDLCKWMYEKLFSLSLLIQITTKQPLNLENNSGKYCCTTDKLVLS